VNKRLRARLFANDRLLKALVMLLAVRYPDLLLDIQAICEFAAAENNEAGNVNRDGWIDLEQELALIAKLTGQVQPSADNLSPVEGASAVRKDAWN